jgi:transketolase
MESLAEHDKNIYMVCTDSKSGVTAGVFAEKYPDRFIEAGIAEQNAVGIAAGLAAAGKTAFVAGPACFLAARSYEQIKIDAAYNNFNVKIIGVSAGVSYGPLGGTHTSLHDIASMRALPNIEIFAPSDAVQTARITKYLSESKTPAYMRIGRGDVETIYSDDECFDTHKAKSVAEGGDITIIACGEMVYYAKQAAELLASKGVYARVLDMFCLKPADTESVRRAAKQTGAIVTVEEHSIHGGLGELVCGITARYCPVPVSFMGFSDEECKIGDNRDLFAYYGLTPEGIAAEAGKLVGV